jgi:hypothetical protein
MESSTMKQTLVAAASLMTAALLVATAASAQPSGSSLQLVVVGGTSAVTGAASAQPQFGSQVTFKLQTSSDQPWVSVVCSQNGRNVYGQYWAFFDGYAPALTDATANGGVFTLGPTPLWSSGAASCTATLYTVAKNHRQTVLATLGFAVAG